MHERVRKRGEKLSREAKLGLGRGDGEARRHRIAKPALAMPGPIERLRLAGPGLGLVLDFGHGVAVHHRLAGDERHAAAFRFGKQGLGGGAVNGTEGEGRRGAMLEQPVEKNLCRPRPIGPIGIAGLLGKGEAGQPVEKIAPRRRQHPVLGEMDVGVDQPGHQDSATEIIRRRRCP